MSTSLKTDTPAGNGARLTRGAGLIFALVFSLLTGSFAHAQAETTQKQLLERVEAGRDEAHETARSILADLDVNANVKLDFSIFDGLEIGFGYTYGVEPSFVGDQYTRIDRWRPRLALELPGLFTRIEPKAELVFIRQFPSQWEALKAVPVFDVQKIPLRSANALRLARGEVVMMPLEMNLLFGKGASITAAPVSVYAEGHYVMHGKYQVQVLRLPESRVRLRLVAIRSEGPEGEVGARLSLDVFNVGIVDDVFQGIIGRKVGSLGFSRGTRAVVMSDYVFDLSKAAAANAYDRLLAADQKFKRLQFVNPLAGAETLQKLMISDLTEVDRIAQEDLTKPLPERRIWSVFKGRAQGTFEEQSRKLDILRLFTLKRSESVSQDNHVVFMDSDNEEVNFLAPTATRTEQRRFLFGFGGENFTRKASIIVPADTAGRPNGMGEYVVSVELKDKRMGAGETKKALKYFRRSMAPRVVAETGLDLVLSETSYRHARVFVQVIFNQDAIAALEGRSRESLRLSLEDFLRTRRAEFPGDDEHDQLDWIHDRRKDIDQTLAVLATAFDKTTEPKERIRIFINLQKNKFFREAGTGYLMSMLPDTELKKLVSVSLRIDAAGFQRPITKNFGESDFGGVVKVVEYIQHMLERGDFDLRLETFGTDLSATGQVVSFRRLREVSRGTSTGDRK